MSTEQISETQRLTAKANRLQRFLVIASAVGLVAVAVLVAATSIWPFYTDLRAKQQDNITFAATTRSMTVEQYLSKLDAISVAIVSRTKARKALEALNKGDLEFEAYKKKTARPLNDAHDSIEEVVGLHRFDINNSLVFSAGTDIPADLWRFPQADAGVEFSGPYTLEGRQVLIGSIPIVDNKSGNHSGTDLTLFAVDELQGVVNDYAALGETGEPVLGRVNDGRLETFFSSRTGKPAGQWAASTAIGQGLQSSAAGAGMIQASDNAEGVILAYRPIDRVPGWAMLVQMSEAELQSAVTDRLKLITGAVALLILLATGGLVLLQQPMVRAMRGMISRLAELLSELKIERDMLEVRVEERTDELRHRNNDMRMVLDNVAQGLVVIDANGVMSEERSRILATWFGGAEPGTRFCDYISATNPVATEYFEMGWEMVVDGFMPVDVCLGQMPTKLTADDRIIELKYSRIDGDVLKVLIVLTDITAEIEAARVEQEQRESVQIFERLSRDRLGFLEFYAEAADLAQGICADTEPDVHVLKRLLHTLKDNCSFFGLSTVSALCHDMESNIEESGERPSEEDRAALRDRWDRLAQNIDQWVGDKSDSIEVDHEDYAKILRAIRQGAPRDQVLAMINSWQLEPTLRRLTRVAEQAEIIARKLGKDVTVSVDSHGLRLDASQWRTFWSSFIHVVRNAVDHGIETGEQREEVGKPKVGALTLGTRMFDGRFLVEIGDDGRGIDWDKVKNRAQNMGLPYGSDADLTDALFCDGMSTKQEVSETSGRGVGMAAVREACLELGGEVRVLSESGSGTRFQFLFPANDVFTDNVEYEVRAKAS